MKSGKIKNGWNGLLGLALAVLLLVPGLAMASKSKDTYCGGAKYLSKDYVHYPIQSIGYTLRAAKAVLAPLWYLDVTQRSRTDRLNKVVPPLKKVLQVVGQVRVFTLAARTLIPWMDKTAKAVKQYKVLPAGGKHKVRTKSAFDKFYRRFNKFHTGWKRFSMLYTAFSLSSLLVCDKAKIFFINVCVKKKLTTKCGLPDEYDDIDDTDFQRGVMYDRAVGEFVASVDLDRCASAADEAKAKKFVALATSRASLLTKAAQTAKTAGVWLKSIKPKVDGLNRALKPLAGPLGKLEKAFKDLDKAFKALGTLTSPLNKLLGQRICIKFPHVSKKKVCTKVKVLGKKKKQKVCAYKLKTTNKKHCTKIMTALNDMQKLSGVIQKPLKIAIDKVTKPLLKKLTKKLPGINLKALEKARKELGKHLGTLEEVMDKVEQLQKLPLASQTSQLKSLAAELKKLR